MKLTITTLEMFETIATYIVDDDEAITVEEAIGLVKAGKIAYEKHEHPGNSDEFVSILDVSVEK